MSGPLVEVVVRAAGERTERACTALLASQLGSPPRVIRERPFSAAVRRTIEIGAASNADWLVAVDADVLVLGDFVERVTGMCGRLPGDAFCATTLVLCRVIGGFVFRGVHLYRVSMLDTAHGLLDTIAPELRPESAVQRAMAERGHEKRFLAHAVGVHDYEQYFRHLYLKAMLRARKDEDRARIEADLARRAPDDVDALVSLWGFEDAGRVETAPAEYDWDADLPLLDDRLAKAGLVERDAGEESSEFDEAAGIGYAERMIRRFDYRGDRVTDTWIRERLGFDRGAPVIVDGLIRGT